MKSEDRRWKAQINDEEAEIDNGEAEIDDEQDRQRVNIDEEQKSWDWKERVIVRTESERMILENKDWNETG